MAQIRKFEQDAIVDSTIAHIVSDKDDTVATLEATPEYASITQMANTIKDLNKQREILSEKSNSVEKELEKLKGLLDKGLITQEAYDAKMNKLLGL